jgi:hypothetical protein
VTWGRERRGRGGRPCAAARANGRCRRPRARSCPCHRRDRQAAVRARLQAPAAPLREPMGWHRGCRRTAGSVGSGPAAGCFRRCSLKPRRLGPYGTACAASMLGDTPPSSPLSTSAGAADVERPRAARPALRFRAERRPRLASAFACEHRHRPGCRHRAPETPSCRLSDASAEAMRSAYRARSAGLGAPARGDEQ